MVGEAVDQRGDAAGVGEDVGPFVEGEIGREDEGLLLVAPRDDLEEQVRGAGVVGEVADLVELCGAPHNSTHVKHLVMWSRYP